MADIETGIYAHLYADATVLALVSTRIYPLAVPQTGSFPAITYQRISGSHVRSHSGPSGLSVARYQLTCWASTYAGAKALAEAVREAMDAVSGTWNSIAVGASFLDSDGDTEQLTPASDTRTYGVRQDYEIHYAESTP